MGYEKSIAALDNYKEVLGDEIVALFSGYWALQDEHAAASLTERVRGNITYLDAYTDGLKEATDSLFADDFELTAPDPLTFDAVEEFIDEQLRACSLDRESAQGANLVLALFSALQTDAAKAAKDVAIPEKDSNALGLCPICQSPAALGIMRDEGQAHGSTRELWCALCDFNWPYPRIKCARCGNEHQDELGYFFAEGDQAHRVYTCDKCGGTLKVVHEAHIGFPADPRVEDLVLEDILDAVVGGEVE